MQTQPGYLSWSATDAPAEGGEFASDVHGAAVSAYERYQALGADVAAWAVEQAKEDAKQSIRSLKVFLEVSRLNAELEEPKLFPFFCDLWLSGRFVPLAKFVTAYPLAILAGINREGTTLYNDPPPRPSWLPEKELPLAALFPEQRDLQRKLRTRLNEKTAGGVPTRRALALAWSFLGTKAMFPALWVDKVGDSLTDHSKLLSAKPPSLEPKHVEILRCIARGVAYQAGLARGKEEVSPIRYSDLPRPKLSMKAGFTKVYDEVTNRWRTMEGTRAAQYKMLGGNVYEELYAMAFTPTTGVLETRQHPYSFKWDEWDFDPKVAIIALQEPFKIRTISVADGPAQAAASPFQKAWHNAMRKLRPFQLIGGVPVVEALATLPDHAQPWVSGDYSAATDRLSMRATKVVFDELMREVALPAAVSPEGDLVYLRDRLLRGLTSSVMDYSRTLDTFRGRVPDALLDSIPLPPLTEQRNGQLMGNILSFPILCMVNLATYIETMLASGRLTNQWWQRVMTRGYLLKSEFDSLDVLVNGDDILFQATPEEYTYWLSASGAYGFKPSVGKNYYSDRFLTVNSELYVRSGEKAASPLTKVERPWWQGFLTEMVQIRRWAQREVGEDALNADLRLILRPMQDRLKASVPPERWATTNRLWITHLHEEGILDAYKGLNWFIPVGLGGLGLDSAGHEYTVTYAQRKLAARLNLDPHGAARFPVARGIRTTDQGRQTVLRYLGGVYMHGTLISYRGVKYIVDKDEPYVKDIPTWAVRDGAAEYYRAHAIVASVATQSPLLDPWLDYFQEEARLDSEKVKHHVSRWLHWGLKTSDRHLKELKLDEYTQQYLCVRRVTHIPVEDAELLSAPMHTTKSEEKTDPQSRADPSSGVGDD